MGDAARGRIVAREGAESVAQIHSDLFGPLHGLPPFSEALLFAFLRRQFFKLGMGVTQIVGIRPRFGDAGFFIFQRATRLVHRIMQGAQIFNLPQQAAMRVYELPMRGGIDHGALIMLAVDLDQFLPDGAQSLGANRLIVDEGARAAVRRLHAPQDQFALDIQPQFSRSPVCGVFDARVKNGGDLSLLLAGAH